MMKEGILFFLIIDITQRCAPSTFVIGYSTVCFLNPLPFPTLSPGDSEGP
jgi:hypothetical protein